MESSWNFPFNMVIFHNFLYVYQRVCQYQISRFELVGGAITILKNMSSSMGGWHPIYEMENNIHVWNHQPMNIGKVLSNVQVTKYSLQLILRIIPP